VEFCTELLRLQYTTNIACQRYPYIYSIPTLWYASIQTLVQPITVDDLYFMTDSKHGIIHPKIQSCVLGNIRENSEAIWFPILESSNSIC